MNGNAKPKLMKRDAIRIDGSLYPRFHHSPTTESQYHEAMSAGVEFPPILVDQHGRVADGIHRLGAYDRMGAKEIPVLVKIVEDDAEFFKMALEANSQHGLRYTHIDYAHMVIRGRELKIPDAKIATLVHVTPGFLDAVVKDWFAFDRSGNPVALKQSIKHMRGRKLTKDQIAANSKLSGMHPNFFANQLILLMETELIDTENEKVINKLKELQATLDLFLKGLEKTKGKR